MFEGSLEEGARGWGEGGLNFIENDSNLRKLMIFLDELVSEQLHRITNNRRVFPRLEDDKLK